MSLIGRVLRRFGWIRLRDYDLVVTADNRIVRTSELAHQFELPSWISFDVPIAEPAALVQNASQRILDLTDLLPAEPARRSAAQPPPIPAAATRPVKAPLAAVIAPPAAVIAPPAAVIAPPAAVIAPPAAVSRNQDNDEEEWEWRVAMARAKANLDDATQAFSTPKSIKPSLEATHSIPRTLQSKIRLVDAPGKASRAVSRADGNENDTPLRRLSSLSLRGRRNVG